MFKQKTICKLCLVFLLEMETLWFCIIDSSLVRMNRDTKPNALNFKFYWFILKYSFVISISSCLNFCRFEFEFRFHIWIEQDDIWIVLLSELCAVLRFFDVICIICMCTQFEMCMHARHRSPSSIIRNAPTADHAVSIAVNAMQCVRKKKQISLNSLAWAYPNHIHTVS